jgi:hypothetical protein
MLDQKNSNKKECCETKEFDSSPTDFSVPPTPLPTSRDVAYSDGTSHKGEFTTDATFSLSIFILYFLNYYFIFLIILIIDLYFIFFFILIIIDYCYLF